MTSDSSDPTLTSSPTAVAYEHQRPVLVLRSALIRVVQGPDTSLTCALDRARVVVGTAPGCSLVLTDPLVSRQHLEIQILDHGYLVLDQGSTNGTHFRGARIREAVVDIGAEITLGSTRLRVEQGPISYEEGPSQESFGGMIGASAAMQEIYGLLAAVAPTDATVLVEGETGTGKELIAEELHRQSPRRHRSFNVVDCGALPANLIESELFGHERGAFTGALSSRVGVFERSQGGTVFLDEIGEMPVELQTRLLRVLEQRVVKRVGASHPRKVDVRLIAATNRDLRAAVREGVLRKDLYFRLAVIRIVVPSLRKRREDIPLLARHFLWQAGCNDPELILTPEVLRVLRSRKWPGNVRELRNVMERAVIVADGNEPPSISMDSLLEEEADTDRQRPAQARPDLLDAGAGEDWLARALPEGLLEGTYKEAKAIVVQQLERLYMSHMLALHGDNLSRIAQHAGIDRRHVRKILKKHGLREGP